MDYPSNPQEREQLEYAHRNLKSNAHFQVHMAWIKSQLACRDVENRIVGYENKISEAKGLADLLRIVDADQAPAVDLNSANAGAERMPAATLM